MKDMTQGSINGHLARMAAFMLFGMMFQTLYYLVDLYFVAHVGSHAIAAVGLCGNLMMVTIALTQALTVGTTTLVAHAIGARDFPEARRVFNQAQVVAMGAALRGAGEVRAPMLVQLVAVLVNVALCPVLIAGWGTGRPLGVAGA